MSKKIAIIQSNYIPWKGYFDIMNSVDEFILLDDVQYTKRDWRNRNMIKTPAGPRWLMIPVQVSGKYRQLIKDTKIADHAWGKRHWTILQQCYGKAPHFAEHRETFAKLYLGSSEEYLSQINFKFIQAINKILGITTLVSWSHLSSAPRTSSERILEACKKAGAREYLSGPSAQAYLDTSLFEKENIKVSWMDYSGYPPYQQLHPPFEHSVSIIDLIFNEGYNAPKYMKSFPAEVLSDH